MSLKNCPRCGRLFAADGNKLCPVCREEEENDFEQVKDYLWDNPNSTIEEVHEETGVERDTIIKFIKEDRLLAEGLDIDFELECERCGAPITHGRFCDKCQQELAEGFSPGKGKSDRKKKKKAREKMYLKDRINKRKKE